MNFSNTTSCSVPVCQRGMASVALVVMLLIMVSVAAITLTRMAGTGLSESVDTNLSGAVLAATDSGLERAGYRLANGTACAAIGTAETWQTVGAATSLTAQYLVGPGTQLANGRCQVQVTGRNAANGRVLRTVSGEFVGGPYTEHFPPAAGANWPPNVTTLTPPPPPAATNGVSPVLGNVTGSSGQAMVGQTPAGTMDHILTFDVTRTLPLGTEFDVTTGMTIPVRFWWRKVNGVAGVTQIISIELLTTIGSVLPVWSDNTVGNGAWQPQVSPVTVPLGLNGQTINRIRLNFNLAENNVANQVAAGFDLIQIGGLVAWQEAAN